MSTINSDGVKITEKTTVASVSGTDKVIINQGDAVKQATVDTLVNGSSLNTKVGLLESLTTGVKTSIVNAINWVVTQLNTVNEKIGTTDISAIGNGTVTGAISTVNQSLTNSRTWKYKLTKTVVGDAGIDFSGCSEVMFILTSDNIARATLVVPIEYLKNNPVSVNTYINDRIYAIFSKLTGETITLTALGGTNFSGVAIFTR